MWKHLPTCLPPKWNRTEVLAYLQDPNSVDCHFEIALKVTCISLNDVKNVRLDGKTALLLNGQIGNGGA